MPERAAGAGAPALPVVDRDAIPARRLALYGAVFVALVCVGAFIAYRELLHYERRALAHVPAGADLVARVDLEQVVLFEPVRRHLLPLLDQASLLGADAPPAPGTASAPGAGAAEAGPGRLARLRQDGELNLGMDLREIVFARRAGRGWLLVLGGIFEASGLVDDIERVLASEPGARWHREAGLLILGSSGVALAQAPDGVLLLGSDRRMVTEALPATHADPELPEGAASFVALPGAFQAWLGPAEQAPGPLASLARVSGSLGLGEPLEVSLRFELVEPTQPTALRRALEGWLGVDAGAFVPLADWGGERALLARARFDARGPGEVEASSTWPRADLDRAARSLANWLGAALQATGPAALRAPRGAGGSAPNP